MDDVVYLLIGLGLFALMALHARAVLREAGPCPAIFFRAASSPSASPGSNFGPTSSRLADRLTEPSEAWRRSGLAQPIPGDAVTNSGSGLDPYISAASALAQAPCIAAARNLPEGQIRQVIEASIEGRTFGIFGKLRANVLRGNRALARLSLRGKRDVS